MKRDWREWDLDVLASLMAIAIEVVVLCAVVWVAIHWGHWA